MSGKKGEKPRLFRSFRKLWKTSPGLNSCEPSADTKSSDCPKETSTLNTPQNVEQGSLHPEPVISETKKRLEDLHCTKSSTHQFFRRLSSRYKKKKNKYAPCTAQCSMQTTPLGSTSNVCTISHSTPGSVSDLAKDLLQDSGDIDLVLETQLLNPASSCVGVSTIRHNLASNPVSSTCIINSVNGVNRSCSPSNSRAYEQEISCEVADKSNYSVGNNEDCSHTLLLAGSKQTNVKESIGTDCPPLNCIDSTNCLKFDVSCNVSANQESHNLATPDSLLITLPSPNTHHNNAQVKPVLGRVLSTLSNRFPPSGEIAVTVKGEPAHLPLSLLNQRPDYADDSRDKTLKGDVESGEKIDEGHVLNTDSDVSVTEAPMCLSRAPLTRKRTLIITSPTCLYAQLKKDRPNVTAKSSFDEVNNNSEKSNHYLHSPNQCEFVSPSSSGDKIIYENSSSFRLIASIPTEDKQIIVKDISASDSHSLRSKENISQKLSASELVQGRLVQLPSLPTLIRTTQPTLIRTNPNVRCWTPTNFSDTTTKPSFSITDVAPAQTSKNVGMASCSSVDISSDERNKVSNLSIPCTSNTNNSLGTKVEAITSSSSGSHHVNINFRKKTYPSSELHDSSAILDTSLSKKSEKTAVTWSNQCLKSFPVSSVEDSSRELINSALVLRSSSNHLNCTDQAFSCKPRHAPGSGLTANARADLNGDVMCSACSVAPLCTCSNGDAVQGQRQVVDQTDHLEQCGNSGAIVANAATEAGCSDGVVGCSHPVDHCKDQRLPRNSEDICLVLCEVKDSLKSDQTAATSTSECSDELQSNLIKDPLISAVESGFWTNSNMNSEMINVNHHSELSTFEHGAFSSNSIAIANSSSSDERDLSYLADDREQLKFLRADDLHIVHGAAHTDGLANQSQWADHREFHVDDEASEAEAGVHCEDGVVDKICEASEADADVHCKDEVDDRSCDEASGGEADVDCEDQENSSDSSSILSADEVELSCGSENEAISIGSEIVTSGTYSISPTTDHSVFEDAVEDFGSLDVESRHFNQESNGEAEIRAPTSEVNRINETPSCEDKLKNEAVVKFCNENEVRRSGRIERLPQNECDSDAAENTDLCPEVVKIPKELDMNKLDCPEVPDSMDNFNENAPDCINDSENNPEGIKDFPDNLPRSIYDLVENLPDCMDDFTENLPDCMDDFTENLPDCMDDFTENLPDCMDDFTENLPDCMNDFTENSPDWMDDFTEERCKELAETLDKDALDAGSARSASLTQQLTGDEDKHTQICKGSDDSHGQIDKDKSSVPAPPREERSAPEGTSSPTPRPQEAAPQHPEGYLTQAQADPNLNKRVDALLKRQEAQFEDRLQRMSLCTSEKEQHLHVKMKEEQKELAELRAAVVEVTQSREALLKMLEQYKEMLAAVVKGKSTMDKDTEQKIKDLEAQKQQALEDLTNVEAAFSDVHRKYERTKQVVETLRRNEESLKGAVSDYEAKLKRQETNLISFQQHAEEKMQQASDEYDKLKKNTDQELTKMGALLKKAEMKIISLQEQLDRKSRDNQELTSLLDELIAKMGPSK
ncbi:uncharacterized protein LOC108677751 isoform X7 [Hyalella azteca]|uniref:Uncharacterized protein LOC108677751 isoform X7 n=1 Tax=Hyalella azteca TaxID=294128 RepID=A0A979FU88_HYAAZ|nr:uncharacterized protein LOC108677751 isoform X7 [Hyalella azteca]